MDKRYYRYYDLMFSQKDYAGEVDAIIATYREHVGNEPQRLCDLGCGTGNHAVEFQRRGCEVWVLDLDPQMMALAMAKGIHSLPSPYDADIVIAMFHVANYSLHLRDLDGIIRAASNLVRPGGLFIFDTWDAILARDDPPMPHRYKHIVGDIGVLRETLPIQYPDDDMVRVVNHTTIQQRGEPPQVFDWEYTHRLWTPAVIRDCLDMAGYSSSEPPRKWGKRSVLYVAVR